MTNFNRYLPVHPNISYYKFSNNIHGLFLLGEIIPENTKLEFGIMGTRDRCPLTPGMRPKCESGDFARKYPLSHFYSKHRKKHIVLINCYVI